MANLFRKIKTNYQASDFIKKSMYDNSFVIVNKEFFITSSGQATVANVIVSNILLSSNAIIAKGSASNIVALVTLLIQSNSVIAKGSSNALVSLLNISINSNNTVVKGSSIANISTPNIFTSVNNVITKGDAIAFTNQLNTLLSANGIIAKGSGTSFIEASNITFTALDVVVVAPISDIVANVSTFNFTITANNVTAFELNIDNNEILLLNSYITTKINRLSTITNKKKWESYIKVKLTLQSKLR